MTHASQAIAAIRRNNGSNHDGFVSMMAERFKLNIDKNWTARQCRLFIYDCIYKSAIYDNMSPWHVEYSGDSYIKLLDRRPCVIYPIPRIIVNQSTSMLFSGQHFPSVTCGEEKNTAEFLQYITRHCNLRYSMLSAARIGSLGSVCIIVKVLKGKFYFDVIPTMYLDPVFDQYDPFRLVKIIERKKIYGDVLIEKGFDIDDTPDNRKEIFWVVREWTETREIYYKPYRADGEPEMKSKRIEDEERSEEHNFEFVPAIWIKNTPDCHNIDGDCTFSPIVDICTETDYQLSQLARLLRYNSDPTMVIKDSANLKDQELIKGAGALELSKDGDAYMLEMTGASTKCVLEFARCLREFALETVRGDRTSPDKLSTVHSGKALQMLNSALISLADEGRLCYGDNGLLKIYEMCLRIIESGQVEVNFGNYAPGNIEESIECMKLDWPDWYPPTPMDDLQEAQALKTNLEVGVVSRETGVRSVAVKYGIIDFEKELTDAKKDLTEMLESSTTIKDSKSNSNKTVKTKKSTDKG